MNIHSEKRNAMAGAHFTLSEKEYLRVHAAKQGKTTSSFIRDTISGLLLTVDDPKNPFLETKNTR